MWHIVKQSNFHFFVWFYIKFPSATQALTALQCGCITDNLEEHWLTSDKVVSSAPARSSSWWRSGELISKAALATSGW